MIQRTKLPQCKNSSQNRWEKAGRWREQDNLTLIILPICEKLYSNGTTLKRYLKYIFAEVWSQITKGEHGACILWFPCYLLRVNHIHVMVLLVPCVWRLNIKKPPTNIVLWNFRSDNWNKRQRIAALYVITKPLVMCCCIKYKTFSFPLYRKFNRTWKRGQPSTVTPTIKCEWC